MIPTSLVIKLIKSFKTGNQTGVDNCIQEIIKIAENKNQVKLASELRGLNGIIAPSSLSDNSFKQASFNSKKQSLYKIRESKIDLDYVALSSVNKTQVEEVITNFQNRKAFLDKGLNLGNKVLLYGKPGTGKTMLAYAIAGQLKIPIIHVFLDELISSYLGETGKNIREIFESSKGQEAIIFLDEFDTIAKKRDDSQELGELKRVVTVLLQNIDELDNDNILITATNHEHLLDNAIWRRFDYQLHIDLPTKKSRDKIITETLKQFHKEDLDIDLLSLITEGMSGAEIRVVLSKILRNQIVHGQSDFYSGIIRAISSKRNKEFMKKFLIEFKTRNPKKYTYKELEEMTGISHSTINSWLKTK
jgi:SpoVK/Ycf46/Vps4 family AAA+-type ATPase